MRLLTGVIIVFVMGILACSSVKETSTTKVRYSRDCIYSEEIQNNSATNAYDLVSSLRPHWLRGRGPKSIVNEEASYPVVYVNDSRHGDVNSLATISTDQITEIRFFNAGDATIRFGLNHPSGAIAITIF
jgi:hypothetical protein